MFHAVWRRTIMICKLNRWLLFFDSGWILENPVDIDIEVEKIRCWIVLEQHLAYEGIVVVLCHGYSTSWPWWIHSIPRPSSLGRFVLDETMLCRYRLQYKSHHRQDLSSDRGRVGLDKNRDQIPRASYLGRGLFVSQDHLWQSFGIGSWNLQWSVMVKLVVSVREK